MIFIKEYFLLSRNNFVLILILLLNFSCSGTQVIGTGVTSTIASTQDEKTLGDVVNDAAIGIGIKDKIFMYEAGLVGKISVDIEMGKVLLTGKVKNQDQRVEIVRLTWKQKGVTEVINEIEISDSVDIIKYAEDKLIQAKIITKVLTDINIKKLKYNLEVQNKIIYIMGVTSNRQELERVIEHARSIKGVRDIISYVDIISTEDIDS